MRVDGKYHNGYLRHVLRDADHPITSRLDAWPLDTKTDDAILELLALCFWREELVPGPSLFDGTSIYTLMQKRGADRKPVLAELGRLFLDNVSRDFIPYAERSAPADPDRETAILCNIAAGLPAGYWNGAKMDGLRVDLRMPVIAQNMKRITQAGLASPEARKRMALHLIDHGSPLVGDAAASYLRRIPADEDVISRLAKVALHMGVGPTARLLSWAILKMHDWPTAREIVETLVGSRHPAVKSRAIAALGGSSPPSRPAPGRVAASPTRKATKTAKRPVRLFEHPLSIKGDRPPEEYDRVDHYLLVEDLPGEFKRVRQGDLNRKNGYALYPQLRNSVRRALYAAVYILGKETIGLESVRGVYLEFNGDGSIADAHTKFIDDNIGTYLVDGPATFDYPPHWRPDAKLIAEVKDNFLYGQRATLLSPRYP
jgi:hypothetical protein